MMWLITLMAQQKTHTDISHSNISSLALHEKGERQTGMAWANVQQGLAFAGVRCSTLS